MESRPSLQLLPNEVLEMVLRHMDLHSICFLRRTSKSLGSQALGPTYKSYFAHWETDLSQRSLRRLHSVAAHPQLGPAITTITVRPVFYDDSRWKHAYRMLHTAYPPLPKSPDTVVIEDAFRDAALEWLGRGYTKRWPKDRWASEVAFQCKSMGELKPYVFSCDVDDLARSLSMILDLLKGNRGLTINLKTRVVDRVCGWGCFCNDVASFPAALLPEDSDWVLLWRFCSHVLKIVIHGIAGSGTEVHSLSIFDDSFGKVQSSALRDALRRCTFVRGASARIKHLTLPFSTYVKQGELFQTSDSYWTPRPELFYPRRAPDQSSPVATSPRITGGVAEFVRLMPNLETLDLCMYNTLVGKPTMHTGIMDEVFRTVRLRRLSKFVIRGAFIRSPELIKFLRAHAATLEALELREVHLAFDGANGWKSILGALPPLKLKRLRLSNLFNTEGRLLNLKPTNEAFDDGKRGFPYSFPMRRGGDLVHTRDISPEEIKSGLSFEDGGHGKSGRHQIKWAAARKDLYNLPASVRELF